MPFDDYAEVDFRAYARDMNRLPATGRKAVTELVKLTLGELKTNRGMGSRQETYAPKSSNK